MWRVQFDGDWHRAESDAVVFDWLRTDRIGPSTQVIHDSWASAKTLEEVPNFRAAAIHKRTALGNREPPNYTLYVGMVIGVALAAGLLMWTGRRWFSTRLAAVILGALLSALTLWIRPRGSASIPSAQPSLRTLVLGAVSVAALVGGVLGFIGQAMDVRSCTRFAKWYGDDDELSFNKSGVLQEVNEAERVCQQVGMTKELEAIRKSHADANDRDHEETLAKLAKRPVEETHSDVPRHSSREELDAWFSSLGQITSNPRAAGAKSVEKTTAGEVAYSFEFPALRDVKFTVFGAAPSKWELDFITFGKPIERLSGSGEARQLCKLGLVTWYEIQDGPLSSAFAVVDNEEHGGSVHVSVWSVAELRANQAREEAQYAPRSATIEGYVCMDGR